MKRYGKLCTATKNAYPLQILDIIPTLFWRYHNTVTALMQNSHMQQMF